jgi:hypothetical protein
MGPIFLWVSPKGERVKRKKLIGAKPLINEKLIQKGLCVARISAQEKLQSEVENASMLTRILLSFPGFLDRTKRLKIKLSNDTMK